MSRAKRRTFILGGVAAAGAALLPARPARAAVGYPFLLGVASGDPAPDGVVLWTRLAQTPTSPDGHGGIPNTPITVDWQVAADENFSQMIRSGTAVAVYSSAHTVHVEVTGLQPATPYFYRFRTGGNISPVGRTRTAPATDTVGAPLTVLTASCAHYQAGYFTAYRRMAEENPDLVVFLGDYIYEVAASATGVRQHLPSDEAATLAAYRVRHAQYKTDPDLQAAHAASPWIPVWDDHEVEGNYANLSRADSNPAGDFAVRRAAAYQAYYEHMPLRAAQAPVNERMQLYRRLRWGKLATFHMLDTRQYRDAQACGGGVKTCPDAKLTTRTITGLEQETWLLNGLGQRLATWDIIGQQVFFAQRLLSADRATSMDAWDGYVPCRDRIQRGWDARGVRGAVVLTGDVHAAYANNLMYDYAQQDRVIGTELVTTSVSSGGDGNAADTSGLSSMNPHIRYYSNLRGYLRTTIDTTHIAVDYRALAKVTTPGDSVQTIKQYVIEAGNPGLQNP
jgi:alkaline phosphatase D